MARAKNRVFMSFPFVEVDFSGVRALNPCQRYTGTVSNFDVPRKCVFEIPPALRT